MVTMKSLASQIRSKNAGPLQITVDIFFENRKNYEYVRDSGVLTAPTVAERYQIPTEEVLEIYMLDHMKAIKISLNRPVPAGSLDDTDMYGSQQHGPLVNLEV